MPTSAGSPAAGAGGPEPGAPERNPTGAPSAPDAGGSIGLVAGGGAFPFAVARAARARGLRVVCVGVRDEVAPELAAEVDAFRRLGLGRVGAGLRYFRRHGVRDISWAGWIRKDRLLRPGRILRHLPDLTAIRFWFGRLRRLNRQSQTLLCAMADEFERHGFRIAHSAHWCPELLVEPGVLTRRAPNTKQLDDIAFGWRVAKRMADLDVGQSVAVFDRATVAVEGIEGTDRCIRRAGELCRRGFVVIKLAREGHDMRFDVPAIGPQTVRSLHQAGGKAIALEAGRTIVLEREETLALANRHGIAIAAYASAPETGA